MTTGFDHFDGSGYETFASALILLCIEEDPSFRSIVENLIRRSARMPELRDLVAWGREETLVIAGALQKRRCDLWLRFEDGLVLVEVKTHSRWNSSEVAKQVIDQQASALPGGEHVRSVVLLAPGMLVRRLSAYDFPKILWLDVVRTAEAIENPSRIVQLACSHWSQNVESDFGLPTNTSMLPLDAVAAQAGCLIALLRAAIIRMEGKVKDKVWFSSPDGRPRQQKGWAWIGVAVAGQVKSIGDIYVGVYSYTDVPPGGRLGTVMEAYRMGNDDTPLVSIPFTPQDFSSERLNTILDEFGTAFEASKSKGSP